MGKNKKKEILLVRQEMMQYLDREVNKSEKESELYNSVYKEISEIVGLDATLKTYLRFKGQQISFPVRLYNPNRSSKKL